MREREKDVMCGGVWVLGLYPNTIISDLKESVCDIKFEKDSQKRRDAREQREGRQSDAVEFESTTPRLWGRHLKMDNFFFKKKRKKLILFNCLMSLWHVIFICKITYFINHIIFFIKILFVF